METFDDVPIVDVAAYLNKSAPNSKWEDECKKVAECLHKYGILIWRDPRVNEHDNDEYIDLMEQYFKTTSEKFYKGQNLIDCKPEFNFQAGVTTEKVEKARNHQQLLKQIPIEDLPLSKFPPDFDAKWRFFWAIGERPAEVANDIPRIIPNEFPEWEAKMNKWGEMMMEACRTAAEMAAVGMGVKHDTFTSIMEGGPHLLSPTGSDLNKYGVGTAFAGFHYDLNFLTIHGRSRFPGLYIWLRNWKKVMVKLPPGCLLLQAGSMFEHITGGHVLAGYHEVIYTEATQKAVDRAREEIEQGKERIMWRVSSTLFSHLRYNVDISPLPELAGACFNKEEADAKYRKMTAHEKLMDELQAINLAPSLKIGEHMPMMSM